MKVSILLTVGLIAVSCRGGREPLRVPEPPSRPAATDDPVIEAVWEFMPQSTDTYVAIGGPRPGRLHYRHFVDMDAGVELERASDDGAVIWRVHVQPFHLAPGSGYFQRVEVLVNGDRVVVDVSGAAHLVEVRDLATGRLISREINGEAASGLPR